MLLRKSTSNSPVMTWNSPVILRYLRSRHYPVSGAGLPATARDRDERIGLGGVTLEFGRREVHASERPDDLKMAQFLGPDVHEQIFPLGHRS